MIILTFTISKGYTQTNISIIEKLNFDNSNKPLILERLDALFNQIKSEKINDDLIFSNNDITKDELGALKGYDQYEKKLINIYPLTENKFSVSLSFFDPSKNAIICIYNLTAVVEKGIVKFENAVYENTKRWKKETVGNITYHYKDKFNKTVAQQFNLKNDEIAKKFKLPPEKFDFYLTDNYQEILNLIGYNYDLGENGKSRDGYGVVHNTIFAIQGNEDFSHDVFHYYSQKINKVRNWITEEGVAYLWGNAYYTNDKKEMVDHKTLVGELKKYLAANPQQSVFELFEKDTKIFNSIAKEISVRSVISGVLMKEVEQKNGVDGIIKMITCGEKMDPYLAAIENQLGITKTNFNEELKKRIALY